MAVVGEPAAVECMRGARGRGQAAFMAGHDPAAAMLAALLPCRDPAAQTVRPSNDQPADDNRWAGYQHRTHDQAHVQAAGKLPDPAFKPAREAATLRTVPARAPVPADGPAVNLPAVDDRISAISTIS